VLGRALRASAPHVLLHTDATQALGRLAIDLGAGDIDLLSMSAHKLHGPKGVGALHVRRGVRSRLTPVLRGGGQEGGLRGGTLNVPGIVGFGAACEIAGARLAEDQVRIAALGRRLHDRIAAGVPDLAVNGGGADRVGGTWSLVFPGTSADALLEALGEDLAVSAGSACSAGSSDVSHVLRAMGLPDELARATLRFVVGRTTTVEEIDAAADLVLGAVASVPRPAGAVRVPAGQPAPGMQLQAVGRVVSDVRVPQYVPWGEQVSQIVLDPLWAPALDALDRYSHAVIVFWMHEVTSCTLTHVPQGNRRDAPPVGMFACRCPYRPNPIAITTVRLLQVGADHVVVQGLDAIDGSPVIDIKPYTPQVDAPDGPVIVPDWVDALVW
jgi:tRNA-Thr(GGU) m(6)t(6)A37 methyltransferase TsaA